MLIPRRNQNKPVRLFNKQRYRFFGYLINTGIRSNGLVILALLYQTALVFGHPQQKNSVTNIEYNIDMLGQKSVYNAEYLTELHKCGRQYRQGSLLPVAFRAENIPDMGRMRQKKMQVIKDSKKDNIVVVVDNKAWDINQCVNRVKTNKYDGDARFILGGYYLYQQRYLEAVAMLLDPVSAKYTVFSIKDMYAWLGLGYYNLEKEAKKDQKNDLFFQYFVKEQEVYLAAYEREKATESGLFFRYLYAVTFIDFGLFLQEVNFDDAQKYRRLPAECIITTSKEAYEKALEILLSIKKPVNYVFEARAFVYKRLGKTQAALEEQKNQGMVFKARLYEQQRKPVRDQIVSGLENKELLSQEQIQKYSQWLVKKYVLANKKAGPHLDSLLAMWGREITLAELKSHEAVMALTVENRKILYGEVLEIVEKRIAAIAHILEVEYLWSSIDKLNSAGSHKTALALLLKHEQFLSTNIKAKEIDDLKKKMQEKIREIELQEERIRQQEEAKRATVFLGKPLIVEPAVQKPKKKDRDTEKSEENTPSARSVISEKPSDAPSEIPVHKRIGIHIDNLIEKKDYVGAYRGIVAYEGMLKSHFNPKEIDKNKKELEVLIRKERGDKFFKSLVKELKK